MKRTVFGAAFGLAVAAALGFGATQSLAAPAPPAAAALACDPAECNAYCLMQPCGAGGRCLNNGVCLCAYYNCGTQP